MPLSWLSEQGNGVNKRRSFREKNGFRSSGYIVKEPAERLEMLILGGNISKEELEAMYKYLMGSIPGSLVKPEVTKILMNDLCHVRHIKRHLTDEYFAALQVPKCYVSYIPNRVLRHE